MLGTPQADGKPLRAHLLSEWRQSGVRPELLTPVECHDELRAVWDQFIAVSKRRTSTGFGPNPIPYGDIAAWAMLHRTTFTPFQLEAFDRLETMMLNPKATKAKDDEQEEA